MSETRVLIKLVAVADVQLQKGQEIDVVLTVPENGIAHQEITKDLVAMFHALGDPGKPTGRAAILAEMGERGQTDR